MIRIPARVAISGTLLATVLAAGAAPSAADLAKAEQRHAQQVAKCNDGSLAAPARDACVRSAGADLDRARGGPPNNVTKRSTDRRSTVVTPQGTPPSAGSETIRSDDRRSTVVQPTDQPAR